MAVSEKQTSQFSIESILRKEEKLLEKSSSFSTRLSLHNEEGSSFELWKKNFYKRDCCPEPLRRNIEGVGFLENRHRLTEHWVYENHVRPLPTLHPMVPSKQREVELVPSPSSTWSPPPTRHQKAFHENNRKSLDYWMADRVVRRTTHPYSYQRRTYSDSYPRFTDFWGNSRHDRDGKSKIFVSRNEKPNKLCFVASLMLSIIKWLISGLFSHSCQ